MLEIRWNTLILQKFKHGETNLKICSFKKAYMSLIQLQNPSRTTHAKMSTLKWYAYFCQQGIATAKVKTTNQLHLQKEKGRQGNDHRSVYTLQKWLRCLCMMQSTKWPLRSLNGHLATSREEAMKHSLLQFSSPS